MCLTQPEAVGVATAMGWTYTPSWERGAYSTSRPGRRLLELLARIGWDGVIWRRRLGLGDSA